MAVTSGTSLIDVGRYSGSCPKFGDNLFDSKEGRTEILNDLFETEPEKFATKDIAILNLLCAPTIKGAETLDIRKCLARIDAVAQQVRAAIDRNIHRLPQDPDYWHCPQMWKAAWAVTVIKRYFGATYNPEIAAMTVQGQRSQMDNARDVFIGGLLDEDKTLRHGTCASIPVLVAAVGRRLGFPIKLTTAGRHVFARWEGDGARFNIEASCPGGMATPPDEHYHRYFKDGDSACRSSSFHLRTLTPAEEFALFMTFRVEALCYAERYDETFLWSARALQFSPDDPGFLAWAVRGTNLAMRRRYTAANSGVKIPPIEGPDYLDFNVAPFLAPHELSLYLTVTAHMNEWWGDLKEARNRFEEACRQNFHGNNEQRDLQRFLKKHGLERRAGPLLPPPSPIRWKFQLNCEPHKRADLLMQLAHEFETNGELVKARNALHDLYMYDPGHSGVFRRARLIEALPAFQEQLKTANGQRRSTIPLHNSTERNSDVI